MTAPHFRFSEPARLYGGHVDIPDIVEEMRQETFQSIFAFRTALLDQLAAEVKPARLARNTTHTAGQSSGADVQYVWLGDEPERAWKHKVPMVYFFCPIPDKVKDERKWREFIADIVHRKRLPLTVTFWDKRPPARQRLLDLPPAPDFSLETPKKVDVPGWIQFDPADPAGSCARKLAVLLRVLRDAERETA